MQVRTYVRVRVYKRRATVVAPTEDGSERDWRPTLALYLLRLCLPRQPIPSFEFTHGYVRIRSRGAAPLTFQAFLAYEQNVHRMSRLQENGSWLIAVSWCP
eukprot:GHVU01195392.1.p5 GENE.GHVU01195392.1~~GHVU01195392.1.p5  ORF type:complete len:101 (+),score=1.60 GHVU01195392.1:779-1081(+)